MIITSEDGKRIVNIGKANEWKAVISTILCCVTDANVKMPMAMAFLKTGKCAGRDGYEIARQFNLIRDELATVPPKNMVYDYENPGVKAPWDGHISPVITSCANLFTTAEGQDLLYEIVSIMCYAQVANTNVIVKEGNNE